MVKYDEHIVQQDACSWASLELFEMGSMLSKITQDHRMCFETPMNIA